MGEEFPEYNPEDFEPNYGEMAMAEAWHNGERGEAQQVQQEPKHGRFHGLAQAASGMAHSVGSHLHLTSHHHDHGYDRALEDEAGERGNRHHISLNPLNALDSAWVRGKNVAHNISNAVHHHGHHHEHVASASASASSTSFAVGQKVERRDNGEDWGTGFVVSLDPLMVTCDDDDPSADGYEWAEVRLPVVVAEVESKHAAPEPETNNVVPIAPAAPSAVPAEDSIHSGLPLLTDEVCQQHIPELAVPRSIRLAEPSWWKCCAPELESRPKKSSAHAGGVYNFNEGNCSFYCRDMGRELFDGG